MEQKVGPFGTGEIGDIRTGQSSWFAHPGEISGKLGAAFTWVGLLFRLDWSAISPGLVCYFA